jgi:3-hydroxybutyryl-CoA dehydratase
MGVFEQWFESLAVGQAFETRGRTITEADVVGFAALTGDWHPNHTDAEWAARSRFGGRIVHGLLLVSYATGLLQIDPARVVALTKILDVRFKAPGRVGDTIRLSGRVTRLRPVNDGAGLVEVRCTIVQQDKEILVVLTPELLWLRRPKRGAGLDESTLEEFEVPV